MTRVRSNTLTRLVMVLTCLTGILLTGGSVVASDGNQLTAEAARDDLRSLVRFLEDTHPDPYSAFGGRVAFQLEVRAMVDRVPEGGLSDRELYDLIRVFLGRMGDGHSYVQAPGRSASQQPPRYLPLRFKVAHDEIVVVEAKEPHAALIGSRLRKVAGLDLDALRDAARNVLPKENDFAASALAVRLLGSDNQLRRMLPDAGKRLRLRLVDPDNVERETVLEYALTRDEWLAPDWIGRRWEGVPVSSAPILTRVWPERDAAYLGLRTIMAREAFENMRASGRTDLGVHLERFYRRELRSEMPDDVDRAILETPSICQASHELLVSMKEQRIGNLIVDLRGNGGGWSTIMKPLYYMLHGDRFFEGESVQYATRLSEGYLRILGTDLESYNEKRGTSYELGDLTVSGGGEVDDPASEREQWLVDLKTSSPDCNRILSGLEGRPYYTTRVFVITDPATFSAAYDTAYHLRRLGAKTVGVPPSQSAHSFVEGTPFVLPNSGLEGAVSRTAVTYPDLPEEEGALLIDHPLTFDTLQRYEFDLDAEVRYVLDLIGGESAGSQ